MWLLEKLGKALLLKTHYFLWFGALTGVLQYTALFGQEHGRQSAAFVGILLTVIPFSCFFTKPIFCSYADRRNAHKCVLLVSLFITLLAYGLFASVPFLPARLRWPLFCLLALIANNAQGVVISLTDGIVMSKVTRISVSYGSVRVFGALGWGLCALLAGYLNESLVRWLPAYVPSVLMLVVFLLVDIVLIGLRLKQSEERSDLELEMKTQVELVRNGSRSASQPKRSIWEDVKLAIGHNPSCLRYIFIATVMGILTAFHWSYFYWFIDVLSHKNTLLMGLCSAVQCVFGELPFFLLAHKIVQLIGPSLALTVSLLAFAIRYLCYTFLITSQTVKYVLVVELTQGPTFGLYYSVMATVAQEYSLKNAEKEAIKSNADTSSAVDDPKNRSHSIMQGIFSACFEGAGLGLGSLIGGFVIDSSRIQNIWLAGAVLALVAAGINLLVDILLRIRKTSDSIE